MRPPKSLIALSLAVAALISVPAFAETENAPANVEITVDLNAPTEDMYQSIRSQSWTACKPELGSHHVAARMNARRACQKAMIADVVDMLSAPELIQLATKDGIRVNS